MRTLSKLHLTPLSGCLGAAVALAAPTAFANTLTVANCNDSGAGSLRAVVGAAVSGDTVDLSGLTTSDVGCSAGTITLKTGAIHVNVDDLNLIGPGADKLTITGNDGGVTEKARIITHDAPDPTGQLYLRDLAISYGYLDSSSGDAKGGCIYSKALVSLYRVTVSKCEAKAVNHNAHGGGVFTKGALLMVRSTITNNMAVGSYTPFQSEGGGAVATGGFYAKYSTVSNNAVTNVAYGSAVGGGLSVVGNLYIQTSTIANNSALTAGGIIVGLSTSPDATATINDSTISGNIANASESFMLGVGGMVSTIPVSMTASTIAFNSAPTEADGSYGGGLFVTPEGSTKTLHLASSIIAANTIAGVEDDLFDEASTFTGANNLIMVSHGSPAVPKNTITACPLLGPLRDNGGETMTHALMSGSPAIDKGNNNAKFTFDQRSTGYARVSGSAADIGAYEVQQDEIIFTSGFDACP